MFEKKKKKNTSKQVPLPQHRHGVVRILKGTLAGFDRHINMILLDCEETRTQGKRDRETTQRQHLGLVLLRGHHVKSLSVHDASELKASTTERFPMEGQAQENLGKAITSETAAPVAKRLAAPAKGMCWKTVSSDPHTLDCLFPCTTTGVGAPAPSAMAPSA